MSIRVKGKRISKGIGKGEALVSKCSICFFQLVGYASGRIIEKGHELEGQSVAGKVLVFPTVKGSTENALGLIALRDNGTAPAAIVNVRADTTVAIGSILAKIPVIDRLEQNPLDIIASGDRVIVDANAGIVEILSRRDTLSSS